MASGLTSVAVVAIAVLFTPGFLKGESKRDAHTVTAFICAFLGLLVTTLLYAVLSGETCAALQDGRANAEEMLGGVAFGFSALSLLYALTLLVESAHVSGSRIPVRVVMGVIAPSLVTLFVVIAAADVAYNQKVHRGRYAHGAAKFYAQTHRYSLLAVWTALILIWVYIAARFRKKSLQSDLASVGNIVAVVSLAVALSAAVIFELIPSADPTWQLAPWAVRSIVLVVAIVSCAQGGLLCAVFGDIQRKGHGTTSATPLPSGSD